MAALGSQTIAASYEQLLHVDTDGGGNTTTLVPVKDGDNGTTFAMQLSTTTVCIDDPTTSSATQGGVLRLQSDDGAVMASGHRLGVIEFGGAEDTSSTITTGARIEALCDATWSDTENGADMVFYTTDGDASQSEVMRLTADAGTLFSKTVTAGVDDTGVDVRVYSATASEGLFYDASEDEFGLLLTTKLKFHDIGGGEEIYASSNGHLEVNAGTTLDITAPTVDINAATLVQVDGAIGVGTNGTGHDVQFFGATSGQHMLWDQSADELVLAGDSKLSFHDAAGGENIIASANGHLEVNSGTTLDMTAPTVDINASTAVTIDGPATTFASSTSAKPLVIIKNTTNDTTGSTLRFVMDKGAAGAAGDDIGTIEWYGDDAAQTQNLFAKIIGEVAVATDGQEGGKLTLGVASHDGEMNDGLVLADGSAEDEIDVTICNGTASVLTVAGHVLPATDDGQDLGSSSYQWRDIYTGDLNLNNTRGDGNEVDGTTGSWTIQEGDDNLFLLNRKTGKQYKFNLEEIG